MQIHRTRAALVVAAVMSVAAAGAFVGAAAGPAAAVTTATPARSIGPGTELVTAGRTCSANFVFRDGRNRVFVGYAASCAARRAAAGGNACAVRSLPMRTRVRFAEGRHTLGYGELRYSSLRAMRRAGVSDPATCSADDFALVQVRGALRRHVVATMPYWGGPSGLGELPAAGTMVFGLMRPSPGARTLPRAAQVTAAVRGTATVSSPLASGRSARGSGFLDDAGRAVGILVASTAGGDNTVVSLADAVAFAGAHGAPGLRLVPGTSGFSGSAVL